MTLPTLEELNAQLTAENELLKAALGLAASDTYNLIEFHEYPNTENLPCSTCETAEDARTQDVRARCWCCFYIHQAKAIQRKAGDAK